jgi:hypothetical protein
MYIPSVGASKGLDPISEVSRQARIGGADDTIGEASPDTFRLSLQAQFISLAQGLSEFQSDFQNLGSTLQADDLAGAKKAYTTLRDRIEAHGVPKEGAPASPHAELPSLFASLGQALEAGDAGSSQQTWSSLLKQLQRAGTGATG